MRAGGFTVQQTLTAEAAGVVKHAVALARQRGHAQVTPLHVAATLLAPGTSLLRRACIKSHPHSPSHPLQCRALELCFKVALNRLPTTAGPLVQGQSSLSNALVAALKRAQAHQRRGCLEQLQQPLLAMKVEMEQLIISILDDPSVSRVMREAGFSSTFVKNNLEEAVSSLSFPCSSSSAFNHPNTNDFSAFVSRSDPKIRGLMTDPAELGKGKLYSSNNINSFVKSSASINFLENPAIKGLRGGGDSFRNEDIETVLEVLLGKKTRRNAVIVEDCLLTRENVVREVMTRTERGDVPYLLRGVQFLTPQFLGFALRLLSRGQVEQKLADLRRAVHNCLGEGPVIIYAGDLRWAVDIREEQHRQNGDDNRTSNDINSISRNDTNNYCPVEHITMELGRILSSQGENPRLWLMATASYQTYMRCQMRQPSLETLWGLQAVPVPSGGLNLTLQASSTNQAQSKTKNAANDVRVPFVGKFNCCSECSGNFEAEAEFVRDQEQRLSSTDSTLPAWLRQCRNVNVSTEIHAATQVESKLKNLLNKWNQICLSKHSHNFDVLHLQQPIFESPQHFRDLVSRVRPQTHDCRASPEDSPSSHRQFPWSTQENTRDSSIICTVTDSTKTTLALGFAWTDSRARSEDADNHIARMQFAGTSSIHSPMAGHILRQSDLENKFYERLAEKVPWQSEGNVRAISSAVLRCRSGTVRKERNQNTKGVAWLLALGPDRMGKRKMAQALAEIVFGSEDKVVCLGSPWSPGRIHHDIVEAINVNPHCVVIVEEIEQENAVSIAAIVKAMETGKLVDSNGREVKLSDTIVFMTSNLGAMYFNNFSPRGMQLDEDRLLKKIAGLSFGLQLVVQERVQDISGHHPSKRKSVWDLIKGTQKRKRESLVLDLNVDADECTGKVDEAEQEEDKGSISGNSDLTQETGLQTAALNDQILCCARDCFSQEFLNSLDKCVVFRPFDFDKLEKFLLDRLQNSYGRASNGRGSLEVETSVLKRIVLCCWELAPFGMETFEKWVEEIFEAGLTQLLSVHTLTVWSIVKLSAVKTSDKNDNYNGNCFYANSRLPSTVEVSSFRNYQSMGNPCLVFPEHKCLSSVQMHG